MFYGENLDIVKGGRRVKEWTDGLRIFCKFHPTQGFTSLQIAYIIGLMGGTS
jgi:hypothetical protein